MFRSVSTLNIPFDSETSTLGKPNEVLVSLRHPLYARSVRPACLAYTYCTQTFYRWFGSGSYEHYSFVKSTRKSLLRQGCRSPDSGKQFETSNLETSLGSTTAAHPANRGLSLLCTGARKTK